MMKKSLALLTVLAMLLTGCNSGSSDSEPEISSVTQGSAAVSTTAAETTAAPVSVDYMARPSLLGAHYKPVKMAAVSASAMTQKPDSDLSNVYFGGYEDWLSDSVRQLLKKNGFALSENWYKEFFELYEYNRYDQLANYVTVDSMMHTYHLYFAHLLKTLEKGYLAAMINSISQKMLMTASIQYDTLKGTEWEDAAKTELAYFAVGASLADPSVKAPDAVADTVAAELSMIREAAGIADSAVMTGVMEDYSQYKPRGYYDTDESLKNYFRTMMWYGRMGFRQDKDTLNRAAVLILAGMKGDVLKDWEELYAVTSFFAGASDDFGYCEMKPVADSAFGKDYTVESLIGNTAGWENFKTACKALRAPEISSVPTYLSDSDEEHAAAQKGFRFMGQRFSIDEASFARLCYREVKENAAGKRRTMPDALDFPAALGSDTALDILKKENKTDYPNYNENLNALRATIEQAPESAWNASLYSAWIYTLKPTIEQKDAAYPFFMQSDAWRRKALASFEGSYTELKHDTVLYSKQFMGEMGGGPEPEYDDRGFVETEPLVFARLKALVEATSEGLQEYGMIGAADVKNMNTLADLAGKLQVIAEKELNGVLPTDEEFDLIRTYGGQLEHFWEEVVKADFPEEEYPSPEKHPAALVVDIATDAENMTCLEVATGNPMMITTLVEVDGKLRVATGAVYSFYQFEQPLSDRLTDDAWQKKQGIIYDYDPDGGIVDQKDPVQIPEWYADLVSVSPQ